VKGPRLTRWLQCVVCAAIMILLSAGLAASAIAAETHVFDPELSLTGDCSVSNVDPVPDPGPCPGVAGLDHPVSPISNPRAVVTDFYGNIYVANSGPLATLGKQGRIIVFDSSGNFITEFKDESGPGALAVDSKGNVYVANGFDGSEEGLVRYEPTVYEPATGQIEYEDPAIVLVPKEAADDGLAINPTNDHLYRKIGFQIIEYNSAAEGNTVVETFGEGELKEEPVAIAVDATNGRIYAGAWEGSPGNITKVVKVFDLTAPHDVLFKIEEADIPGGKILSSYMSLAADEGTGHLFIYDANAKKVYEFDEDGHYLSTIAYGFQQTFRSQISVDNGANSPNGALNPFGRYLFVPSHPAGTGHTFAFGPSNEGPPVIESVSFGNVSETEAELRASIEPSGLDTEYIFEYLTQLQYEEQGLSFEGAQVAGDGVIPAGNAPVDVAAAVSGLTSGVAYRFRVVATNPENTDQGEGVFSTYPSYGSLPACPNDLLRTALSVLLPDCRAYELVTPPDTNARSPRGVSLLGTYFPSREASPAGTKVSFQIEGGTIPGSEGTGSLGGDAYLSSRGSSGWSTSNAGPNGSEAKAPTPGSTSPDQGYSFWSTAGGGGSFQLEDKKPSNYVRYPDGHSALIGRGAIGTDQRATGRLISENGAHIIFESGIADAPVQLEENAPVNTRAVYDRTSDEVTHVISLLPGDLTPAEGETAFYQGVSLDGRGVAFKVGSTLYLRYDNQETFEIGGGVTFEGIAEGGSRIFYLEGGVLKRFDAQTETVTVFSASGSVTPTVVSADGSTAYFISSTAIGGEVNPNGATPVPGKNNLYRSEEGEIAFVGTVTDADIEHGSLGEEQGLGMWNVAVDKGQFGVVTARTTPAGGVLLFESQAALAGYDPEGHAQVYRFDGTTGELDCLSCNPTRGVVTSDSSLQSIQAGLGDPEPFSSFAYVANLSSDGQRAFFQSEEALVPGDSDGLQDVYEWEAQGVGSCAASGGCLYLISSGHSLREDYLYAVSDSGDDVFFRTSDILLPADAEETPSIYDARVGGGFPEPVTEECAGEGCRPRLTPAPPLSSSAPPATGASDNVKPKKKKHCPKGKRKAHRGGKVVCVKKNKSGKHRKTGKGRRAAR
jgi:hypothetical protein